MPRYLDPFGGSGAIFSDAGDSDVLLIANPPFSHSHSGTIPAREYAPGSTHRYAVDLGEKLAAVLGQTLHVWREWSCLTASEKQSGGLIPYASVLDLAVGPFASECSFADEYDKLIGHHSRLLEALLTVFPRKRC